MNVKMKAEWKTKTQKIVMTGLLAALLAVLSQVSFPLPSGIPVTLQTFAVALCGFVLGPKLGVLSVGVYLALGAVGLPIFAGFSGGAGAFAGMTGGYLWGFLFMALLCGLGTVAEKRWAAVPLGIGGLALCHLCGAVQFAAVASVSPWAALLTASAPYLIKDVASVVLAYLVARAVLLALKRAGLAGS